MTSREQTAEREALWAKGREGVSIRCSKCKRRSRAVVLDQLPADCSEVVIVPAGSSLCETPLGWREDPEHPEKLLCGECCAELTKAQ